VGGELSGHLHAAARGLATYLWAILCAAILAAGIRSAGDRISQAGVYTEEAIYNFRMKAFEEQLKMSLEAFSEITPERNTKA
jgi:hypothetical protein